MRRDGDTPDDLLARLMGDFAGGLSGLRERLGGLPDQWRGHVEEALRRAEEAGESFRRDSSWLAGLFGGDGFGSAEFRPEPTPPVEVDADVFEEVGFVRLVAEMPGVSAGSVRVERDGAGVRVSGAAGPRRYRARAALPASADVSAAAVAARNGLVEVRFPTRC